MIVSEVKPTRYSNRDIRQREIIPPEKLASCRAIVIGVGAIGRQVAVQLAAVGISVMTLIDSDTVNVENLAPQAYWPADLCRLKVEATAQLCRQIHPDVQVQVYAERFKRSSVKTCPCLSEPTREMAVFCCVDSIESRKLIWEALHDRIGFWADGRMAAEVLRVLANVSSG